MIHENYYRTATDVPTREDQRVRWTYTHHMGRSHTPITKRGVFIRLIDHPLGRGYRGKQMALVLFDGNKNPSRIPLMELFLIAGEDSK